MEPITKRIAVYIRVSTEEQVDKFGLDLQKEAILAMIKSKSHTQEPFILAGEEYIYCDDGVSGTVPLEERPAFSQMIEDITFAPEGKKPFDAVAVYKIDRFARKLTILMDVVDFFTQNDVQFVSVSESIDTSTPFGRAMLGFLGIIAELERDTIVERTQAGREQALSKGVHMGNASKFGFIKDENKRLKVFRKEADVVELIFEIFVNAKMSVYEIAEWLTKNEYVTPDVSAIQNHKRKGSYKNKKSLFSWHPEKVRGMLQDEVYIGKAYYNKTKAGKKVPKSEWFIQEVPRIIDPVNFEKAQQLLKESKHQKKISRANHIYLLSGLLRCEACREGDSVKHLTGTNQKVKSNGKKVHYYVCKGKHYLYRDCPCQTLPIAADLIEEYVVEMCRSMLANPIDTFKYQQKLASTKVEINHLRTEEERTIKMLEAMPARKERLREEHEMGAIDSKALKAHFEELNSKTVQYKKHLEDIRFKMSQNTLSEGYLKTFALFKDKYLETLNDLLGNRSEVYDILHLMIDEISVYSRPVKPSDKVAGRKKEGQQIPYRIHIKFKLPQEMFNDMSAQKVYITEKAPVLDASSGQKDVFGAR